MHVCCVVLCVCVCVCVCACVRACVRACVTLTLSFSLLEDKRKEIGDIITKLRNGLEKIDETRTKVQAMTVELEETRVKVAQFQKECEEYLVVIVQQKQDADEQAKAVTARSEKIAVEEAKCKEMAEAAQHDLDEALPALEEAVKVGCCGCGGGLVCSSNSSISHTYFHTYFTY